jgi:malate dehydrogenase
LSVITAAEVEKAKGVLTVAAKDVVTPLARDRAKELGVRIERAGEPTKPSPSRARGATPAPARAALPSPSATQSGALYRRGASVPSALSAEPGVDPSASDPRPVAAVIGAGHVGAMTALRLAEISLLSRIVLTDIVPGLAAGLALDMWHSASLRGFTTRIEGSADLSAIAGANYVVVTAGKPRQPGMSRTDLTGVNAAIIGEVAEGVRRYAPESVVVVVTNPLEEMTHLMAKTTGFPAHRVVGMAGVLDGARFQSLVALTGVAKPQEISAIALGSHGPEMVIPLSQAKAKGAPLQTLLPPDQIDAIVERARDSGAEVVKLLQKGSAYFAPAESAAAMVAEMLRESGKVQAVCVQSGGAYGIADTRVGLPVKLGRMGVKEIVELPLTPSEKAGLANAASSIAARVRELG